jgi:predicted  nucleic acid-binding Zn-ribbon protein
MNLCSDDHDEVCYESNTCPVCDQMSKVKDLEGQVDSLEDEKKNAEKSIDELTDEISGLKAETGKGA